MNRVNILKSLLVIVLLVFSLSADGVSAETPDVSGEWIISIEFLYGNAQHTAVIRQNGAELSGEYSGAFKKGILKGEIKADEVEFTGYLRHEASSMVYRYTGTVSGNSMSGTVDMGEYWTAKWKAEKNK